MRHEFYEMNIPSAAAPSFGTEKDLRGSYEVLGVQLFLDGGTGTMALQGSYDGTNFVDLHTAVNSNGFTFLPDVKGMRAIRVNKTVDFSGTNPIVTVCLRNIRED